jgi:hypothetical protein
MVTVFSEAVAVHDVFHSAGASPKSLMIAVGLTAGLNLMLGTIIIKNLYYAGRAAKIIERGGQASMKPHQRQYTRIAIFISESAIIWVVTAIFLIVTVATHSDIAPFFELLFDSTTVGITELACDVIRALITSAGIESSVTHLPDCSRAHSESQCSEYRRVNSRMLDVLF